MTNWHVSASDQRPSSFDLLTEPIRRWIWQQGWEGLRDIQERAIPVLLEGKLDVIIAAPTAAGKTEAALLPLLSRNAGQHETGFKILYISPLKALINDQFQRIDPLCQSIDLPIHRWHGDISAAAKERARRRPDGIVLMTPESLEALCVRRGIEIAGLFASLDAVVVDELHAFIGSERGIQLQSLLRRLEIAIGRSVLRIGLSATLGDLAMAAEFLRPRAGHKVVILESRDSNQRALLQVRGYMRETSIEGSSSARKPDRLSHDMACDRAIARHIVEQLRGAPNLVFATSRTKVELYADLLRRCSENIRVPNEFYPHHANLSRGHREFVETRLRNGSPPTSAVCTSTLELGIDIGEVESVAQIEIPWSVAALRQRLGRSGRRGGKPAIMRLYVTERAWRHNLHLQDVLRCELVQAVAMIQLLLRGWCEPPRQRALHLSTLLHQILAFIAQRGGASASHLYEILCHTGPFGGVSPPLFAELLRGMATPGAKLIEQTAAGTLLLGEVGDRIVDSYEFFSVFKTPEEYRLVCDGHNLGTLPMVAVLVPNTAIIFSGRRWRVLTVNEPQRTIIVSPSQSGVPPPFGGDSGELHDGVVAEMRRVYENDDVPAFLDKNARMLLAEARGAYGELGLAHKAILERDNASYILPWAGTIAASTLVLALKDAGLSASLQRLMIETEHASANDLRVVLGRLAESHPLDPVRLVNQVGTLVCEKYDCLLPQPLLAIGFAADRLAPGVVATLAQAIIDDRTPRSSRG